MQTTKKLLYFNALFDLNPGNVRQPALHRAADEMTTLFLPMGSASDSIVLNTGLPDGYRDYLTQAGLSLPRVLDDSKADAYIVEPWGWDSDALLLAQKYGDITHHPDISAVRNVNSRKFCSSLPVEITRTVPGSVFAEDQYGVENALEQLKNSYPLVVKPNFGSSGFGFLHLTDQSITAAQVQAIRNYLQTGGAVIEPWVARLEDISCSIEINRNGVLDRLSFFRCIVNRRGTFNGVHIPPEKEVDKRGPFAVIEKGVRDAVKYIVDAGYFGPASIDSFLYIDRAGKEQVVAVGEINARHIVSDIGRAIGNQIAPCRHSYFRFTSRKLLRLPENYSELRKRLGSLAFCPESKKGVLVVTPLRVGDRAGFHQPYRNGFFISADSSEELFAMDRALLGICRAG